VIVIGFAGILGLSARLTGGGTAAPLTLAGLTLAAGCPPLGTEGSALGVDGRVDVALECCEMRSLTFPRVGVSPRVGDLEGVRP
jgi:hypothetical protein